MSHFPPHPSAFGRPVPMGPDPNWVARLKRHQDAIHQLTRGLRAHLSAINHHGVDDICAAIEYLLGADIAAQLDQLNRPAPPIPRPSLENLECAQREVEGIQGQLEALDKMTASLPKETGEYLGKIQRPMLESQLQQAQAWLSNIQQAMEAPEPAALAEPSTDAATSPKPKEER